MNLRSPLRALALAVVCALPLPAGVLTFTLTETGTNQITVTANGNLTDSSAWNFQGNLASSTDTMLNPTDGMVIISTGSFASGMDVYSSATTQRSLSGYGTGAQRNASGTSPDQIVGFWAYDGIMNLLYLPSGYLIRPSSSLINSSDTLTSASFSSIGATPGTYDYYFGGDQIRIQVGPATPAGVPDTGASAAGVGLALAGLFALRGRRAGRRTV
jgi:hypothetical protein